MDEGDKAKYKGLYLQTARAYIRDIQNNLPILLKDPENMEVIKLLHLASHSLASQSMVMDYMTVGSSARAIENIFKTRMDGQFSLTSGVLELIGRVVDKIAVSVDEVDKTGHELDLLAETKELEAVLQV